MSFVPPPPPRLELACNVAMMYALALPVLMFAIGLAIDYTHAAQVRTQLNAAADAVVLTPSMMRLRRRPPRPTRARANRPHFAGDATRTRHATRYSAQKQQHFRRHPRGADL